MCQLIITVICIYSRTRKLIHLYAKIAFELFLKQLYLTKWTDKTCNCSCDISGSKNVQIYKPKVLLGGRYRYDSSRKGHCNNVPRATHSCVGPPASLQCQHIIQGREPDELATAERPFGITVFMGPEIKVKVGIPS